MENNFDYYFISGSFANGIPRFVNDDEVSVTGTSFLSYYTTVPTDYVAFLTLGAPIPPDPGFNTDGLYLRGNCRVFSGKIVHAFDNFGYTGIQFVPAVIRSKDREQINGFYVANLLNKPLYSFDQEKTLFDGIDDFINTWDGIEKVVLDREKLTAIPIQKRLVYAAAESPGFILYHKSIVDTMRTVDPVGLKFTAVEEWCDGMQFI